jgi:hypothetical protein
MLCQLGDSGHRANRDPDPHNYNNSMIVFTGGCVWGVACPGYWDWKVGTYVLCGAFMVALKVWIIWCSHPGCGFLLCSSALAAKSHSYLKH